MITAVVRRRLSQSVNRKRVLGSGAELHGELVRLLC